MIRTRDDYAVPRVSPKANGVPRSSTIVGYAPFRGPRVCVSLAGRIRGAHAIVGDTCAFCEYPAAPKDRPSDDALPDGGPQVTAPARDRQHDAAPEGHGLIPPQDPSDRQPGQPLLPSAARRTDALAEVRKRRGRELIFSRRCRSEQRTRP